MPNTYGKRAYLVNAGGYQAVVDAADWVEACEIALHAASGDYLHDPLSPVWAERWYPVNSED